MSDSQLKQYLTPEFVEQLDKVVFMLYENRKSLKESMGEDYATDLDWDEVEYFISFMKDVANHNTDS